MPPTWEKVQIIIWDRRLHVKPGKLIKKFIAKTNWSCPQGFHHSSPSVNHQDSYLNWVFGQPFLTMGVSSNLLSALIAYSGFDWCPGEHQIISYPLKKPINTRLWILFLLFYVIFIFRYKGKPIQKKCKDQVLFYFV